MDPPVLTRFLKAKLCLVERSPEWERPSVASECHIRPPVIAKRAQDVFGARSRYQSGCRWYIRGEFCYTGNAIGVPAYDTTRLRRLRAAAY